MSQSTAPTSELSAAHTRCPRCDYDLDGAIASFTDHCPLQGTCSECGMEFDWANLLRADRRLLPWLFEHSCRPVRGFIGTLWRSLLPGRFWKAVQMWHLPRVGRLWVYALVCSGGLLLIVSVLMCVVVLGLYAAMNGNPFQDINGWNKGAYWQDAVLKIMLSPFVRRDWYGAWWVFERFEIDVRFMLLPTTCLWGISLSWPIMMLLLSDSRREAKVRRAHVLRAWAYSLWWSLLLSSGILLLRFMSAISEASSILAWKELRDWIDDLHDSSISMIRQSEFSFSLSQTAVWILFLWTARWWWVVIVRYWKFSSPGLVYWLIFIVSFLCMLIPAILGAAHGRY